MSTTVRYFPRSGLVLIKGRGVTTTFRVKERGTVNYMLGWLGYKHVNHWEQDGTAYSARTQRAIAAVAA